MLEVQKYLATHTLSELEQEFGISANHNSDDRRVILNYCQIESSKKKFEQIVKECRGLILERNSWELVAKAFDRFYNLGENPEQSIFNWNDFHCTSKEDGSLILVYFYNGNWCANTRNSFGEGYLSKSTCKKWKNTVYSLLPDDFPERANKNITYVFELCTLENQVVRYYEHPQIILLSCFVRENELKFENTSKESSRLGLNLVPVHGLRSETDVIKYIAEKETSDKTFEGLVLNDGLQRIKVKSRAYVDIHYNFFTKNIFQDKNLLEYVLKGDMDEVLSYYPELRQRTEEIERKISEHKIVFEKIWDSVKHIENRKEFALAIKDSDYEHLLFSAKDGKDFDKLVDYKFLLTRI